MFCYALPLFFFFLKAFLHEANEVNSNLKCVTTNYRRSGRTHFCLDGIYGPQAVHGQGNAGYSSIQSKTILSELLNKNLNNLELNNWVFLSWRRKKKKRRNGVFKFHHMHSNLQSVIKFSQHPFAVPGCQAEHIGLGWPGC